MLTAEDLGRAVPLALPEDCARYAPWLGEGRARFGIDTPARICAFIAQVAHESGDFRRVEEGLNYSWQALRVAWPTRFTSDEFARAYHRQPEKIASYVYAGRNGNGDEASGDGWRFRGRGLIQVTGRANYRAYADALGEPGVLEEPALLAEPRHAALSACWYWASHQLNALADLQTEVAFNEISYRVNGGWNGRADRLENWNEAKAALMA